MKKLFIMPILAIAMISCAPLAKTYQADDYQTAEPAVSVLSAVYAELDVTPKRISYAERVEKDITTMTNQEVQQMVEQEKKVTMANAIRKYDADLLIAPKFHISTKDNRVIIMVEGYPATYKNFRNATAEDAWILQKAETETTAPATKGSIFSNLFHK